MKKQAIIMVSFGTTRPQTRECAIGGIERAVQARFPGIPVFRAFTSHIVIREIEKNEGISVPSLDTLLASLKEEGYTRLVIQPTHIIHGEEYEKLHAQIQGFVRNFEEIRLGAPLLNRTEDYFALLKAAIPFYHLQPEEALIWMGHGTAHFADAAYSAMDSMAKDAGYEQVFVTTVEGYPTLAAAEKKLRRAGYRNLCLAPLMVVAGDHAENDMAGPKDSFSSALAQQGYQVRCVLAGLGEIPAVQEIYLSHLQQAKTLS